MQNDATHYKWREIAALPDDLDSLRDRELESLFEVWIKEKERIGDDRRIQAFNQAVTREWAIETGIIEGVYTLDRGITQTLIERGIDSSYISHTDTNRDPELVARIIRAHADVLEGLFAFVKTERKLTTGYMKELHAALLTHQDTVRVFDDLERSFDVPLEKGAYKRHPNNPMRNDGTIHEYCPPEHTAAEMDRLALIHDTHLNREVKTYIEAAWLHHAFTQIHPFQDGNGRVARALASLVLVKAGYFPLVVTRDDRERYIDALESADSGNLFELVRLFCRLQKRSLTQAIGLATDARPIQSVDEALSATRDMLVGLGRIVPKEYLTAKQIAGTLRNRATSTLDSVAQRLRSEITEVDPSFTFSVGTLGGPPLAELRSVGAKLKYDPNTADFHETVRASFNHGDAACTITISFHGVGAAFRGVIVAVGYFQIADTEPVPVCEDIFRVNYKDGEREVVARFTKWLDGCLIEGIARWRRTLV